MGNGVNTDILIIYKFNQCTNSFTVDQQLLICKRLFLIQWGFFASVSSKGCRSPLQKIIRLES